MTHTAAFAAAILLASTGIVRAQDMTPITFGDGSQWKCVGQQWTGDDAGAVTPPDKRNLHSRAFYTARAYSDFTAEFEYNANYREGGAGDAGLILRAQDGGHFYYVHFPWCAQTLRAKNYWGGVAKVSGDGYLRNIVYENVRSVPSEVDRWYKVKVEAKGPRISIWIDGRKAFEAHDDTYKSGFIGFAGYGWYFFRNLRVNGTETPAPKWDDSVRIQRPMFELPVDSKVMPSGCMAPNGDVLIGAGKVLLRSTDKGRTWTKETSPEFIGSVSDYGIYSSGDKISGGHGTMFCDSKGRLFICIWHNRKWAKKAVPEVLISESRDNGKTWAEPIPSVVAEGWPTDPARLIGYGPLCETEDGTLLRFMYGGVNKEAKRKYTAIHSWGAYHGCKAYCARSTDGGKTWSAAIDMDRPTWNGKKRGDYPGSVDFTEPTGVAIGNTVMVTIRPVISREMWQCWSFDAGKTWDAASRTTFPGYAQTMIRTKSGAIVCGHRNPNYSINVSYDNGLNWDAGTVIDYPGWAMGCMIEVEPDVLLITYMNWGWDRRFPLLAQLIRVTPNGIEPIDR